MEADIISEVLCNSAKMEHREYNLRMQFKLYFSESDLLSNFVIFHLFRTMSSQLLNVVMLSFYHEIKPEKTFSPMWKCLKKWKNLGTMSQEMIPSQVWLLTAVKEGFG